MEVQQKIIEGQHDDKVVSRETVVTRSNEREEEEELEDQEDQRDSVSRTFGTEESYSSSQEDSNRKRVSFDSAKDRTWKRASSAHKTKK